MVRAGKHGNCIGGRGWRSAFYLGSALPYAPPHSHRRKGTPSHRRTRVSGRGLNHSSDTSSSLTIEAIERVPNADGDESHRLSVDAEPTSSVEQRNESRELVVVVPKGRTLLLTCYIPPFLHGSFFESCFSLPPLPVLPSKTGRMEYSQVGKRLTAVPEPSKPKVFLFSTFLREGKDRRKKAIPSNQPTRGVEHNTEARFFY
ncbi:hypothetical protein ACFE04_019710 [Oxalis oulophora]